MSCRAALIALGFAALSPALAGQSAAPSEPNLVLPPAADTGKPAVGPPPGIAAEHEPSGCAPALPCGTRLLGAVRRNGAVEFQVPAWRW